MTNRLKCALLAIVFILGYSSLSFELIVLRQLINFVGSNTLITSIVITFILMFMSIGYYIGSVMKLNKNKLRCLIQRMIISLNIIFIFASSYYIMEAYFIILDFIGLKGFLVPVSLYCLLFIAAPSVFMGFITSSIGRIIHHYDANYTGRFMAVDTFGSVAGSIATTLIFMPFISVSATIIILIGLTSFCMLIMCRKKELIKYLFLSITFVVFSYIINQEKLIKGTSYLIKDDAVSRLEIIPDDFIDNGFQSKLMKINGSNSSKISDNQNLMFDYIKFINNQIIAKLDDKKVHNILVLGAGGFTVGIDDHKNNYTFLDVEKNLQTISEDKFLENPLGKNKKFIYQDAYLFMLNDKNKYDLIVVDVYSSVQSIPLNFVTANFFNMVKEHLNEGGIMVANIITSPDFKNKFSQKLDNTLRAVFTNNLNRQVLHYNNELSNVEYIYYNYQSDDEIYTLNKSSAMYGQDS